jgi:heptosyltransferase-1
MRILLIKTSSLGDVIHNLPVASDLRRQYPSATIDWVVEEGFAQIPALHPAIAEVIPVALRRWRRSLFSAGTRGQAAEFRRRLGARDYDLIIDTQGLLKSALIARLARGRRCGYNRVSAREPLAARLYDARFGVPRKLHAVERNRQLAAAAAGYEVATSPDYGIAVPPAPRSGRGHAVLLTATSRADKLWPEEDWVALGKHLHEAGLSCRLPGGNDAERERAARIAATIPGARGLPPMDLRALAAELAAARLVVGVDTGLVHLAAALGRPTLALFRASDPELTGVMAATPAINLGRRGTAPSVGEVLAAARPWLQ